MELPKTYPAWVFDDSPIADPLGYGERAVNFILNLRHPRSHLPGKGFAGRQAFRRDHLLGFADAGDGGAIGLDGTRIVKTVFLMMPRGNRKTALGAALALLHTIGPEREIAGQVVCAAADQKQARIAFEEASNLIRQDARLERVAEVASYRNRITNRQNAAWLEAISADGATQHGRTPAFVLADELHAWKKRDLWEALKTGLVKTAGALNVIITTAGRGHENIAFEQYDYARRVA
ncbi:MAG: phage terminase, partial [Xanthobacteraceae bacterium]